MDIKHDNLIQPKENIMKNKIILNIKFQDSEVNLPAYIVPIGILTMMLMVLIEPLSLLIAIPIIISFMGGVVMEKISLEYDSGTTKNIPIFEDE